MSRDASQLRTALVRRGRRAAARALGALCAALATGLMSLACAPPPPADARPPGALLSANAAALAGLLDALALLEGTPLARRAAELRARLPACAELEAAAPDGDAGTLFASLRCADARGPLAALHAERGTHDLAFALPGEPGKRASGHAELDGAAADVALRWPALEGPLAELLPGDEPAGPDRLAVAERVAHGRARSAGPLDLAALVPRGSQGDRLFRLRDGWLAAALLDGSVELGLYAPEPGAAMPRTAAALGVRQPEAARAAMERFLDEIAAAWSLRRTPFAVGASQGACLPDLQLVPELAPCYALADDALVLGWNASSLRHALASSAPAASEADPPARFDVDLAGLRAVDLQLASREGHAGAPLRWPWRRIRGSAQRQSGALELKLLLLPEKAS